MLFAVDLSGIPDASKAKRSPGDGDLHTSNSVIYDLVPAEHRYRIGPVVPIYRDADHLLVWPVGVSHLIRRQEFRVVDGFDRVEFEKGDDV